jgi:hypothetical protein
VCLCLCLCLSVCSTNSMFLWGGKTNSVVRREKVGMWGGVRECVLGHSRALAFCLSQHRHLFTSSPQALAFSAVIHNKNGVGRSGGCGDVTILSLLDVVVCCVKWLKDNIVVGFLQPRFTGNESRPGISDVSWILIPISYHIHGKSQKDTPQAGSVS